MHFNHLRKFGLQLLRYLFLASLDEYNYYSFLKLIVICEIIHYSCTFKQPKRSPNNSIANLLSLRSKLGRVWYTNVYFRFITMSSMIESQLKYHVFSDKIMDTVVNFQVLKLKDSFYVWMGSSNKLGNVTVAMPTKFVSKF